MSNHNLNLSVYIDCEDKFVVRQVENYFKEKDIHRALACHDSHGCIFIRNNIQVGDISRISACRRKTVDVPIMIYTGFSTDNERISLYGIGIDMHSDFPRPFEELYLRYMVMARRYNFKFKSQIYHAGSLTLKYLQLVFASGTEIKLQMREYEVLAYLFQHPGILLRRSDIMEAIKGESDFFATRELDVYLSRIRKHLSGSGTHIECVHGRGIIFHSK